MKINFTKFAFLPVLALILIVNVGAQSNHHARSNDEKTSENNSPQAEKKSGENKPLEIIEKKPPRVRIFEKCFVNYGATYVKIRVRVTFHSSGKVTDVEVADASGCQEFDEEAIRVARIIKFKPAVENGEAITVVKQVVYEGGMR